MATSPGYAAMSNHEKDALDKILRFYSTHRFTKISPRIGGPYMYKRTTPHLLLVSKISYSKYAN